MPVDHVADGIYISGWRATLIVENLRQRGITNVLKLFRDTPFFPDDFNVFELPVEDGEPLPPDALPRGVAFVLKQVEASRPVLVMCGAGISRSATFVLAALVARGYDLPDGFALLHEQHPDATPHPHLWQSLIDNFGLDYPLDDALTWMRELRSGEKNT
ncbi:MAG: dual specificity protein phosphatase family protein [Chloroflexi bacterium]|nr:dual specificity protein phosphatase family protein [Chloroflexota bacterium]